MKTATLGLLVLALIAIAPSAFAQHVHHTPVATTPPQAPSLNKDSLPSSASILPTPTAEERAAAFPDTHGLYQGTDAMRGHMDDDPLIATLLFDRLEWQHAGDAQQFAWELQGWAGRLDNRVWLRSKGESYDQQIAEGDVELLWGRPTGPWWDALIGIRHDLGHGPNRDWLAIGLQGLAPYKFEVAATLYVGENEHISARAEIEYDVLLTSRLVLQPRFESNYYNRNDAKLGVGKGISDAELGLRLRYELHRQFAPYLGYTWSRKFGETADLAESTDARRKDRLWVAGVRFWF